MPATVSKSSESTSTSSFLEDWRQAKAEFEKNTGKKRPSEKFLGIFRKSSGLEESLKKIDAAVRKNDVEELAQAREKYKKTYQAYTTTLEKAAKPEKGAAYHEELMKLTESLERIDEHVLCKLQGWERSRQEEKRKEVLKKNSPKEEKRSEGLAKKLEADSAAMVTLAEAIGPTAVALFKSGSPLLKKNSLIDWLKNSEAEMFGSERAAHCGRSKDFHDQAKKKFAEIVKLYDNFKKLLTSKNKTTVEKARKVVRSFYDQVSNHTGPGDGSLQGLISKWRKAQGACFSGRAEPPTEPGPLLENFENWQKQSSAWKQAREFEHLWHLEVMFLSHFMNAIMLFAKSLNRE